MDYDITNINMRQKYTSSTEKKPPHNDEKNRPLPEKLEKLVSNSYDKRYEELYNELNGCAERVDESLFQIGECFVKITTAKNAEQYKYLLEGLRQHGIEIVPEFVCANDTKEGFSLLVYKVKGADEGSLIKFEEGYNLLSSSVKNRAYSDIKKLIDAGMGNYDITNKGNLYITPDKEHRIVVVDWEKMYQINDVETKLTALDRVRKKIYKTDDN